MKTRVASIIFALTLTCVAVPVAHSFPQFQEFSEKHSGRTVNCAMCHLNDDGPAGDGQGQIGSLSPDEVKQLNKARTAFEPGSDVNNPILNKFGNEIIHTIGMKKFLASISDPSKLPESLGNKSDLDGDGIPDAQEYLDGTDPLNKFHGDPIKLFFINLNRSKLDLLLAASAVFLLAFGLANLVAGASQTKVDESK